MSSELLDAEIELSTSPRQRLGEHVRQLLGGWNPPEHEVAREVDTKVNVLGPFVVDGVVCQCDAARVVLIHDGSGLLGKSKLSKLTTKAQAVTEASDHGVVLRFGR